VFKRIAKLLGLKPKTIATTAAGKKRLADKLESLLETTADAVVGVASNGHIALVNPQTENLFGYLRDEVLGKPIEILLPEIFQPGILGRRTLFLLDPETRPMGEGLELHGRRKDGSEFPADVGVSRFKHEELVAVFFIRDMTDILQAEQALLESRAEFREIVESAPDAMVIADSEGRIQIVNAETERLFGYARDELLGHALEVLVPELVRTRHRKHRGGYSADPRVRAMGRDLEPHGQRKDGSVFPVEISLSPLHTKAGILISSVIRDITQRKQAEKKIQHLNLVLRTIRNVNQLIVGEKSEAVLIQKICQSLMGNRGYNSAWIVLLGEQGEYLNSAETGLGKNVTTMKKLLKDGKLPDCANKALKKKGLVIIEDPNKECKDCPISKNYPGSGGYSACLRHGGTIYGLLVVSVPSIFINNEEQGLFREICGDIGFALSNIEVEKKRKKAEEELEKHRNHLKKLVKKRTAELEEKNKELERFNKLFVGREFRIKELKDKVKELEKEAGRKE
jgi:PAS domain S-box-containing protein